VKGMRMKGIGRLARPAAFVAGWALAVGVVWMAVGAFAEGPPPVLPAGMRKGIKPGEYVWSRDESVMMWVTGGPFQRGTGEGGDRDETPASEVRVSGFFIDKFEVTNGQYRRFYEWWLRSPPAMRRQHSHPTEPEEFDHRPLYWPVEDAEAKEGEKNDAPVHEAYRDAAYPVVGIRWYSAWAYAHWAGKSLPTEAEWEKAASRDEAVGVKRVWPWGNDAPDFTRCNFDGNVGRPVRPGQYPSGRAASGAHDMAGNVWEWCLDFYHKDFYATEAGKKKDPVNQYPSAYRVVRGGSYNSRPEEVRTSYRDRAAPHKRYRDVGFRCVVRLR